MDRKGLENEVFAPNHSLGSRVYSSYLLNLEIDLVVVFLNETRIKFERRKRADAAAATAIWPAVCVTH